MVTFDSLRVNDSHEKLNQRTRTRTRPRSSDDNNSTFFLRKVELKREVIEITKVQVLSLTKAKNKFQFLNLIYIYNT